MIPHVNKEKDALDDIDLTYDIEKSRRIKWYDWLLLNRTLKVIIALILTTIVAPILLYQFVFITGHERRPSDGFSFGSCLIARESRLPCGPGNVTAKECHSECCYDYSNDVCFHRFPSRFSYILNEEWSEDVLLTPRIATVPFRSQRSFTDIRLSVDEVSPTHLSLTFYKSKDMITGRRIENKNYRYHVSRNELNIMINATHGIIFNTARGPLIGSNDIWEMAFKITDETMYGLGEIPLTEGTVKVIYNHKGGLSSIPLIFAKSNGSYHGLLIDTLHPTEINIRSENQLVIRSITNWGLKFHLFVGPKPADIMRDVMKMLQVQNKLEYWMLGAHVCSEPARSLADLRTLISTASTHSMPFESHCGLGPVVFSSECDNEFVSLMKESALTLRNNKKKYVPHVSPYILYTQPEEDDQDDQTSRCFDDKKYEQFILQDPESKEMYIGTVNSHDVIYPDYKNVSKAFMQQMWTYNEFDAAILENNWPLDESEQSEMHLFLPYFNENFEVAFQSTPQWNATRPERYLYTHNEYGNEFATAFAMIKGQVPIISTSQWMNGNVAINRQGIETSWSSLQKELVEASLGGISGHWHWSSPICGDTEVFDDVEQARLCAKWYMAATYFPMIKIHSKETRRDPLAFVGIDRSHMITALNRRMSLLPYLYSVLQEGPVLRPMFYQFPSRGELSDLRTQFSVGDDLIIIPNLQPRQTHVHVWTPPGQWFEFWGGSKVKGDVGKPIVLTTTEADFLTLIRGGSIVVKQEDTRLTTGETQKISAYTVVIALHCETNTTNTELKRNTTKSMDSNRTKTTHSQPTTCSAKGKFFMTPDMAILFEADARTLTITTNSNAFYIFCDAYQPQWASDISFINIYGLDEDKNNYDEHRHLSTNINLCNLQNADKITYDFVGT